MIVLQTDRVYLRDWVPEDWTSLMRLATDPRVMRYIGRGEPWSDDKIRNFIDGGIEVAKIRGWILWPVINKQDDALIGICGFNAAFSPDVEIGWWLMPEFWGRGIASEIARATMQYGFRTFNFSRLISVCQPGNRASIRVMEKLGMKLERRFVHDGVDVVAYMIDNPN